MKANFFEGLLVVLVVLVIFVPIVIGLPIALIAAICRGDGAMALVLLALNWILFGSIYKSIRNSSETRL